MNNNEKWEHGSDFHWNSSWKRSRISSPWDKGGSWYSTGRDTLKALINFGRELYGWKRIWIPSYFCQKVVRSLLSGGIDLVTYPYSPLNFSDDSFQFNTEPGDVLLLVNIFGLQGKPRVSDSQKNDLYIIEDHTHDPWSEWARESNADYCIASLRKVLPVPDGSILWSPLEKRTPQEAEVTDAIENASSLKFKAMVLKDLFLKGYPVQKDVYLNLFRTGEAIMATGEISGLQGWVKNILGSFPTKEWRIQRLDNFRTLSSMLKGISWLDVLQPNPNHNSCPFSVILVCDSQARRDSLQKHLIEHNVYPAILWPLNDLAVQGVPEEDLSLSNRILSIHSDMRYGKDDMERVSVIIRDFVED